jgi:transitional endoplasmic reticulum ATPase
LRELFDDAARQERAIIFFDEIDSIAGHRSSDSHEASRRVVAQLLTRLDGFRPTDNIVVIATTNRPQDIDIAMRRPGRFDWVIEFRNPNFEDRVAVLEAIARSKKVSNNLDHAGIAGRTDGWNSAELDAIFSEAALLAANDGRAVVLNEDYFAGHDRVAQQHRFNEQSRRHGVTAT